MPWNWDIWRLKITFVKISLKYFFVFFVYQSHVKETSVILTNFVIALNKRRESLNPANAHSDSSQPCVSVTCLSRFYKWSNQMKRSDSISARQQRQEIFWAYDYSTIFHSRINIPHALAISTYYMNYSSTPSIYLLTPLYKQDVRHKVNFLADFGLNSKLSFS